MKSFHSTSASRRVILLIVLPLILAAIGAWQWRRAIDGVAYYQREQQVAAGAAEALRTMVAADPMASVRTDEAGNRTSAAILQPMAEKEARGAGRSVIISHVRHWIAFAVILGGIVALLAGVWGLVLAARAERRAGQSREALVAAFRSVRARLPLIIGAQVAGLCLAICCALLFEVGGALNVPIRSTRAIELIALVIGLALGVLWVAFVTLRRLAGTLAALQMSPMDVNARALSRHEAPVLWSLVERLAARQGAPVPDAIGVGMLSGFFVTSGAVLLHPEEARIDGHFLHLHASMLPFLNEEELTAIIAHELAHFAGKDTVYSEQFLPIYTSFQRSLGAMAGISTPEKPGLLLPANTLIIHLYESFEAGVQHWGRLRELEADAAGVEVVGAPAAANAMVRVSLAEPIHVSVLDNVAEDPAGAPTDLLATMIDRSRRGFGDTAALLEAAQPHPFDTHPPSSERLRSMGITSDAQIAAALARPADDSMARALIPNWPSLAAALSADLVRMASDHHAGYIASLQELADKPGLGKIELFNAVRTRILIYCLALGPALGFLLCMIATVISPTDSANGPVNLLYPALGFLLGPVIACGSSYLLWRAAKTPFMVLEPDTLTIRGLERPIPWSDVEGYGVGQSPVVTNFLLSEGATMPPRLWRWNLRVRPAKRLVSVLRQHPRGYKRNAYVALLDDYITASRAREALVIEQNRPVGSVWNAEPVVSIDRGEK